MNPEKMRDSYGKLMYLLMDSQTPAVNEMLEFCCVSPITTVYSKLGECNALAVLSDPLMETATLEIMTHNKDNTPIPRNTIQKEIKQKERAIEILAARYKSSLISDEEIKQCLYSIGDNNSFLRSNRDPIDDMIILLKQYFTPEYRGGDGELSLAISAGRKGARLSHSHERQYYYVLQSLTLWREVHHNMFKLWYLADLDMLDQGM